MSPLPQVRATPSLSRRISLVGYSGSFSRLKLGRRGWEGGREAEGKEEGKEGVGGWEKDSEYILLHVVVINTKQYQASQVSWVHLGGTLQTQAISLTATTWGNVLTRCWPWAACWACTPP